MGLTTLSSQSAVTRPGPSVITNPSYGEGLIAPLAGVNIARDSLSFSKLGAIPDTILIMPRHRLKRVFLPILLGALILLPIAIWVGWRFVDTSKIACDPQVPIDGARLAMLNPFRDRGPEGAAILVMKAIESGGCRTISPVQHFCSDRKSVAAWKITGRGEARDKAFVRIWVTGQTHDGSFGDNALYVRVQKVGVNWNVTSTEWSDSCGY